MPLFIPVRKPLTASRLEPETTAGRPARLTPGSAGAGSPERSRSFVHLAVKGRRLHPLPRPIRMLETVIGSDDRSRIVDTELAPWRMICALRLRGQSGEAIGTGWFVGPRTVLTAGHCVYSTQFFGGWAQHIEVSPGRNGDVFPYGTASSERFSSVNRWTEHEDPDFDIGVIHLDTPLGEQVGWFAVGALSDADLSNRLLNVSGYPGDRGDGAEQYFHRNRVLKTTERRIFYDVDTYGGQSGAPVWVHDDESGPPIAVGIHAYGTGGTPAALRLTANSAPRIVGEVVDQIAAWVADDGGWPAAPDR